MEKTQRLTIYLFIFYEHASQIILHYFCEYYIILYITYIMFEHVLYIHIHYIHIIHIT